MQPHTARGVLGFLLGTMLKNILMSPDGRCGVVTELAVADCCISRRLRPCKAELYRGFSCYKLATGVVNTAEGFSYTGGYFGEL